MPVVNDRLSVCDSWVIPPSKKCEHLRNSCEKSIDLLCDIKNRTQKPLQKVSSHVHLSPSSGNLASKSNYQPLWQLASTLASRFFGEFSSTVNLNLLGGHVKRSKYHFQHALTFLFLAKITYCFQSFWPKFQIIPGERHKNEWKIFYRFIWLDQNKYEHWWQNSAVIEIDHQIYLHVHHAHCTSWFQVLKSLTCLKPAFSVL